MKILSKRGVILSCSLIVKDVPDSAFLEKLGHGLEGQKYGFLEGVTGHDSCERTQEVVRWLIEEIGS